MNLFSHEGKALPNKVQEEIVKKYLDNYSVTVIAAGLNLPYKSVSNIIDVWLCRPTITFRTVRTGDVIAYAEFFKQNKPNVCQRTATTVGYQWRMPSREYPKQDLIMTEDLGYSYKKISQIACETDREDVIEKLSIYIALISEVVLNRLHFFDESSVLVTSGNRTRGHSATGQPAIEVQRYASNATYTVNLLHNVNGVSHCNIIRGASNVSELLNLNRKMRLETRSSNKMM